MSGNLIECFHVIFQQNNVCHVKSEGSPLYFLVPMNIEYNDLNVRIKEQWGDKNGVYYFCENDMLLTNNLVQANDIPCKSDSLDCG